MKRKINYKKSSPKMCEVVKNRRFKKGIAKLRSCWLFKSLSLCR